MSLRTDTGVLRTLPGITRQHRTAQLLPTSQLGLRVRHSPKCGSGYCVMLPTPIIMYLMSVFLSCCAQDDNLGFRLQAEAYLKRKAEQDARQARTGTPASPRTPRRPPVLHGERGDPKDSLRHREGAENYITNVTTAAEPPRQKRRNSLLSG
jgi:hypothetical protein